MRINDNNCVDKAENVIKKLVEDSKQKYRGKINIVTTSIRNHVSLTDLKRCMKYTENVGDRSEEKGRLQIMTCVTDPYGNPYIPGSSLKGMLRTILLSKDIKIQE